MDGDERPGERPLTQDAAQGCGDLAEDRVMLLAAFDAQPPEDPLDRQGDFFAVFN